MSLLTQRSVIESFERCFGREPQWLSRAPGRVNLIGEHTDYNDGLVLPVSLEQSTWLAAAKSDQPTMRLRSTLLDEEVFWEPGRSIADLPVWARYVAASFKMVGVQDVPLTLLIESDVPRGGGLSSSAALCVATLHLGAAILSRSFGLLELAKMAQRVEHDYAGVPCGLMDQVASLYGKEGHLVLFDTRHETVQTIPFPQEQIAIVVINSMEEHALAESEYAQRRIECERASQLLGKSLRDCDLADLENRAFAFDEIALKRARHVISENGRVRDFCRVLRANDLVQLGQIMSAGHDSLRDDFEVSTVRLDFVVDTARALGREAGVLGARMTGGGFGGSAVILVRPESQTQIVRHVQSAFEVKFGVLPDVLLTATSNGAEVVPIENKTG